MLVCTTRHLAASDRHEIWRLAMAFHQLLTVQNVINNALSEQTKPTHQLHVFCLQLQRAIVFYC